MGAGQGDGGLPARSLPTLSGTGMWPDLDSLQVVG